MLKAVRSASKDHVLIICYDTKRSLNQRTIKYIGNIKNFDYIAKNEALIENRKYQIQNGLNDIKVVDAIKNLSYFYRLVIFEHCPLYPQELFDSILSDEMFDLLMNSLTKISGRIIFIVGHKKENAEYVLGILKEKNFKFEYDYMEEGNLLFVYPF